jgi:RHS repeat-associated protein
MKIAGTANGNQFLNLTYDRDGKDQLSAENSSTYGYDPNGRVNGATTGSSSVTYGYDAADNLTRMVAGTNTTTNIYDAANQVQTATTMSGTTQVQKYSYTFDPNGNRTSRTDKNNVITNYGWDQAGRLTSVGTGATYGYNGDGLRMTKTAASTTTQFTWEVATSLPLVLKDGSTAYVYGPGGLPIEQVSGSSVLWFGHDQIGSTRALLDNTGATQATYSFDSYGNLAASTGTLTNPIQYAAQYLDSESSLYYLRARSYDPVSGQFMSRDPAVTATRQPYAYVADNPLNGTDPTGLWFWEGVQSTGIWIGQHLPASARKQYASAVQSAGDYANSGAMRVANGWANGVTFGASTWAEQQAGVSVNTSDPLFEVGNIAGAVTDSILLPAATLRYGGYALGAIAARSTLLGRAGAIFGNARYTNGVWGCLNRGVIRIGWSGKKGIGDTFRIAVGEKPGPVFHFDLWPFNT